MGSQRESSHPISLCARQPGQEPCLDVVAGRGLSHAGCRGDGGHPSVARESAGCRQLEIGQQLTVVQQSPQVIVIQPVNPQVVYVPMYNPAVVYGYPYVVPAYVYAPPPAGAADVAFGVGVAVGAMMAGGSYAWGYSSWNCGWHGTTAVVYHGGTYYGNSAWHGGYYGSSASAYGAYGSAHVSNGYNPSTGTYARGGTVSNGYGSVSAGQAYNPRTGASASTVQGSNAYGNYGASTVSKN